MIYGKLAVGGALWVALSSSAMAQEVRKLDFGLQGGIEHNSNVARTSKGQAALRGLSPADTIYTPSATVDAVLPVGRQALFLNGAVGYSFYDKNDKLDRERLNVAGGVRGRVGMCAVTLTGGYTRGVSEFDDPTLVENVENIRETDRVAGDVRCARQTGLGVVASISKDWARNDLAFAQQSDSERRSMMLGVTYSRPTLGVLTIYGNRDKTEYPHRIIEDGYDLDAIGVTYERQLGARIQGSVTVAYTQVTPHLVVPGSSGKSEITAYSAHLSYRASNRLRFSGAFDRSVMPSTSVGRSYDLTDIYRLSADYDLGSRIKVNAGAAKVKRNAEGALGLPINQLTDSETESVFGSVRYQQSKRLAFTVSAGREERTTNAPQFNYTNERIGVSADVAF
ncbi:outer membrane beta-barrel protein [Phenylobacterium sp. Root700]|uniref:outer membrane beta-barrel protein n=1 Tax=Phenylobacterium sp. Root700 TaxID=1736591 RepID=UPI000A95D2DA|nr:outer membrane beta-barrel protein [Phenylobacterium sp. Root700]